LIKTFNVSRDKNFAAKVEDVVGLYLNPPDKAHFCRPLPIPRDRDWPPPRLLRQSLGKLKAIPPTPGGR
jgi:hypothetical protein